MPYASLVDHRVSFDAATVAVSLVQHNHHARIIYEREERDGSYYIGTADFLPYDADNYCVLYGADLSQLWGGKDYPGIARNSKIRDLSSYDKCTRKDIFEALKLSHDKGITWQVTTEKFKAMRDKILPETNSHTTAPRFNIKGKVEADDIAHNCCSWAVERLKFAGIAVPQENFIKRVGLWHLNLPDLPPVPQLTVSKCILL